MILDLLHGLWSAATTSVWTAGLAAIVAIALVTGAVQAIAYPRSNRDPVRRFARADKAEILRRAGGRCENHGLLGRCKETTNLEADHVIPWSRSGPTIVGNGQALCRAHNRNKSARVMYKWELRRLAQRRLDYFPDGVSGMVSRRRPL